MIWVWIKHLDKHGLPHLIATDNFFHLWTYAIGFEDFVHNPHGFCCVLLCCYALVCEADMAAFVQAFVPAFWAEYYLLHPDWLKLIVW